MIIKEVPYVGDYVWKQGVQQIAFRSAKKISRTALAGRPGMSATRMRPIVMDRQLANATLFARQAKPAASAARQPKTTAARSLDARILMQPELVLLLARPETQNAIAAVLWKDVKNLPTYVRAQGMMLFVSQSAPLPKIIAVLVCLLIICIVTKIMGATLIYKNAFLFVKIPKLNVTVDPKINYV